MQHCTHRPGRCHGAFRRRCDGCAQQDPALRTVFASATPLRCPRSLVRGSLRRVAGLSSPEGIACLRDGEAFVCQASDLIGGADSPLLKWDLDYLQAHLPKDMTWPVLHRGTGKIVMTHSSRYLALRDLDALDAKGVQQTSR